MYLFFLEEKQTVADKKILVSSFKRSIGVFLQSEARRGDVGKAERSSGGERQGVGKECLKECL